MTQQSTNQRYEIAYAYAMKRQAMIDMERVNSFLSDVVQITKPKKVPLNVVILDHVKANPNQTAHQIAAALNVGVDTVRKSMARHCDEGKAIRTRARAASPFRYEAIT